MTNATPYREAPPPSRPAAPAELFCPWQDAEGANNYLQLVGVTFGFVGVATACVAFVGPWGLAVAGVGAIAYARWRKARPPAGVTLRVEQHRLVLRELRIALDDLVDVEAETKKVERVTMQQPVGAPMMGSVVGPSFDASRVVFVVLEGDDERRIAMTEAYAPGFHCTEWLGKVRVFLRKNGWVPEDERDDPAAG